MAEINIGAAQQRFRDRRAGLYGPVLSDEFSGAPGKPAEFFAKSLNASESFRVRRLMQTDSDSATRDAEVLVIAARNAAGEKAFRRGQLDELAKCDPNEISRIAIRLLVLSGYGNRRGGRDLQDRGGRRKGVLSDPEIKATFHLAHFLQRPLSEIERMPAIEFDCCLLYMSEQHANGKS